MKLDRNLQTISDIQEWKNAIIYKRKSQ